MRFIVQHNKFFAAAVMGMAGAAFLLWSPQAAYAQSAGLVISQIFGGGGGTSGYPNRDFVELFNGTGSSIDLTGYTVQYAAANSTFSTNSVTLSGSIASGRFYLVGFGAINTSGGTPLPTPDAMTANNSAFNLSPTAGKVALANNTTTVTFTTGPNSTFSSNVVDFVGYGSTANAYEGTGPTPTPSNTTAVVRKSTASSSNFIDSNNNSADFFVLAPDPRNSQSNNIFGASFVPSDANTSEPGTLALGFAAVPVIAGFRFRRRCLNKHVAALCG